MMWRMAWRNLWRQKWRTSITIGVIAFSVLFAVIMQGVKEGMYERMINNLVKDYIGHVRIQHKDYQENKSIDEAFIVPQTIIDSISGLSEVQSVLPRVEAFLLAASDSVSIGVQVMGMDIEKEKSHNQFEHKIILQDTEINGVYLGKSLAEYLEQSIGDSVTLFGAGYRGQMAAGIYAIRGIVNLPSPELNKSGIIMPIENAQYLLGLYKQVSGVNVLLQNPRQRAKLSKEWSQVLPDEIVAMPWEEISPDIQNLIEADRVEGYILSAILYIIIGFVILGTIVMMTAERKFEFGVLLAIGMHRNRLMKIFGMEMSFIAFLGCAAGFILGMPLLLYFNQHPIPMGGDLETVYQDFGFEAVIQTSVAPHIFIQQMAIVLVLVFLAAQYTLVRLRKLSPVEAMHI